MDYFDILCQRIIIHVGESNFKSELYIDAFLKGKDHMHGENTKVTGACIPGGVKLAITLRLLAGGDALDVGVMFDQTIALRFFILLLYIGL